MMDVLSDDVLEQILEFLTNDGLAVGRFSLCSKSLLNKVVQNTSIWKQLYHSRWTGSSDILSDENEMEGQYRLEYQRRHLLDKHVEELLFCMTNDLRKILNLKDDNENDKVDGDPHVGHAWDHICWTQILNHRNDAADILRFHAKNNLPNSTSTVYQRLLGFLASRCLQNIQFGECLHEWKQLAVHESRQMGEFNLILMEKFSILVCHLQQTPEEQLDNPKYDIDQFIMSHMDSIAEECDKRIREQQQTTTSPMSVVEKLLLVKDILVNDYQFAGNRENYYDYRNSLLNHVLETRKGIPITLCVIFACICRRLNLRTFIVGLPGHIVLGFQDNTGMDESGFYVPGETMYLDVFHSGQILTVSDCQQICNSYQVPWNDEYLKPLSAAQVLDRTFNNLSNCHLQAMAEDSTSAFRSDLFFQQRALASIHRQPKSIAGPLVERLTQDLPLTLSPELLRYYNLLSSS